MNEFSLPRYKEKSKVLKALAHPIRLWIAEQLMDGERCVSEFVDNTDVEFSTISKHLAVLREAGVVADEKRGKQVYYRLVMPCILHSIRCIEAALRETTMERSALPRDLSSSLVEE